MVCYVILQLTTKLLTKNKRYMNKFILSIALCVSVAALPSCSGEGEPLSASTAKSALKKEAIFAKDSQVKTFEIGYQEVSEEYLNTLAKLKAAGVINFSVEQATETIERREYSYWSGYYYTTYEVNHFFADVQLTESGKKFIIEEPTTVRADLKEYVLANENYEEKIPEYMSANYNAPSSDKASDEAVAVEEETVVEEMDTVVAVTEEVEIISESEKPKAQAPAKKNLNEAYKAMCAKINTNTVNVLLGHYELIKVKDVLCTEDMFKAGKGSCTVYVKFVDKTPFGFVLGAPSEGYVENVKINFIHYQDSGWVVAGND